MYRALLHLYPKSFRGEYEGEMCAVFAQRLRDASGFGLLALWIETFFDVLFNAVRVHLDILRQDLRYVGRTLRAIAGLCVDRGRDRGTWHRRDDRGLFDHRPCAAAASAVSRRRPAGDDLADGSALLALGVVAGQLSRLEESEQIFRGVRRVCVAACEPGGTRRAGSADRRDRDRGCAAAHRRETDARPLVLRRGRSSRRGVHGADELLAVAGAVRRERVAPSETKCCSTTSRARSSASCPRDLRFPGGRTKSGWRRGLARTPIAPIPT